jgi:amino acid adenylation domain-containing protein
MRPFRSWNNVLQQTNQSLHSAIETLAKQTPDAIAMFSPGRRPLTYPVLWLQLRETLGELRALGVGSRDCVAVGLSDGPELAVAVLAISSAAVCAPLHPDSALAETVQSLADLKATALIVGRDQSSALREAATICGVRVVELVADLEMAGCFHLEGERPPIPAVGGFLERGDTALALHTSGTAAQPRLVLLSSFNLVYAADNIRQTLELTPADRSLTVMPLFHIHGLSTVIASLLAGASVVCASGSVLEQIPALFSEFQPTWYSAAPAIHRMILDCAKREPELLRGSRLRFVRSASAPMPAVLMAEVEAVLGVPFLEAYGLTEAGPLVASNRLAPFVRKPGSVGLPAGVEVSIQGEDGEIAIRGLNVGRYANEPTRDPEEWLLTGDLGRLDTDGYLFVTGRRKEIINRGGEKISPREVEEVLLEHPLVREAAVFGVPHEVLGENVAAAIVLVASARSDSQLAIASIRSFVSTRLAHFKTPQQMVAVEELPVGLTAKLSRQQLAKQLLPLVGVPAAALKTPTELRLAAIWMEVLECACPGRHDNFFALGGHSLAATRVIGRIRKDMGVALPMERFFGRPTVDAMAECIEGLKSDAAVRRGDRRTIPLSFEQRRLWFLDQLEAGGAAYNMSTALRLRGKLDPVALRDAISAVYRRHEILTASIRRVDGEPCHVLDRSQEVEWSCRAIAQEQLRLEIETEAQRAFVLEEGPLLRAALLEFGGEEHVLLLTMHHIVSDGWSVGILWREVGECYSAKLESREAKLPPLGMDFAGHVEQQRARMHLAAASHLGYWREQLRGAPATSEFPTDRPRPAFQSQRGVRFRSAIGPEIVSALRAIAQSRQASLYAVTLAAFQVLLARCAGQQDVVVGTPVANRTEADTEALVGFFANTLPMRASLSGDPEFPAFLESVKAAVSAALEHQEVALDRLIAQQELERDPRRTPLFQVMFAFQNVPSRMARFAGLEAETMEAGTGGAKFDVTLYLTESGQELKAEWLYNPDLFDTATIEALDARYREMLARIGADPQQRVSELFLEGREWTASGPPVPGRSFGELFEARAEAHPEQSAVEAGGEALTYGELNAWANQVASLLEGEGNGLVGVYLPRECVMVAGVVGVWKAGRAYVPLDPCYPAERLLSFLTDAGIATVLTCRSLLPRLAPLLAACGRQLKAVCVDRDDAVVAGKRTENPARVADLEAAAYVIYTSGTTGTPKGVVVTHANLGAYAQALPGALGIVAGDRYLHTASLSFSSSVRQIVVPLTAGATVIVATEGERRNQEALLERIVEGSVTIADLVPTHWASCVRMLEAQDAARREAMLDNRLRMVLSASEPLPARLVRAWWALGHTASIVNMYGQTETTGIVATHPVRQQDVDAVEWVPVGRPIAGTSLSVVDAEGRGVPVGTWGELEIGGANVAKGYLGQPPLTGERFGRGRYRSGDRARMRPDGVVELGGRLDQQLKVRGYRVEPAEVELLLCGHPGVLEAAVAALGSEGESSLVAGVVARAGVDTAPLSESCKELLSRRLPAYMVPRSIVVLSALPRTANGKLDRAALAALLERPLGACVGSRSVETQTEQTLAQVWREVLRINVVGPDDNFFDLGGDSIRSVDIVAQGKLAGLNFSLRDLFQNQTVSALARVIDAAGSIEAPESSVVRVSVESLRSFGRTALEQAGLGPEGAAIVTEVQLESSLRGQPTHNMADIPRYARRLAKGVIAGRPEIRIVRETGVSSLIDGGNGPGQWVATVAIETAIRKARESGIAIVGAKHSNHFGAAGQYAWQAAEAGLIAFCTTNGPLILAPTGGIQPTFGNNPIAVGLPAGERLPVVLDIAMSTAPRGRIGLHLAEGRGLEPGWILNSFGRPSQDLADLAAGLGMPIGGHKGYGLALAMEALAGVLTGAGFCWDHEGHRGTPKPGGLDLGHLFIVIDPEIFLPAGEFQARVDRMIEQTKGGKRASGVDEIFLPGEQELLTRAKSLKEGVTLRRSAYQQLCQYAAQAGIAPPQTV